MAGSDTSWFVRDIPEGRSLTLPGIYEWRIEGVGSYVGKSKGLTRRLREYPNNVRKLLSGLPYRRGKPDRFRRIHHELRAAMESGRRVTVTIIENCSVDEINERERYWIVQRGDLND